MLNTTHTNPSQGAYDATHNTQKFLRRHGASLCTFLDMLDDPSGLDALCNLHARLGTPFPDARAIEAAVRDILSILADLTPSSLDRLGLQWGFPASDAARWHGARIYELLSRFEHAA